MFLEEATLLSSATIGINRVVNFCKDHPDKTELPDPLAVEDLITYKLINRQK